MAGEFGPDAGGWGDESGDLEPEGESLPNAIDIGGGLKIQIDHAAVRRMLNSPEVKAQVDARGRALAAECNRLAVTKGAEYAWLPSDHPDNTRARGRVVTANYKAQVDDAHHSTLLKALASVGSDPKPDMHEGGEGEHEGEAEE